MTEVHPFSFKIGYLLLLGVCSVILSCDPKDPQPEKLDFSCIKMYDGNGQGLGTYNCNQSSDWEQIALTTEENAYLNFTDTVSLTGTMNANITQLAAFPNPVIKGQPIAFLLPSATADQPVKLRLAIIDENKNVLRQLSLRINTNQIFHLQLPEETYPPGHYYRVYYRASSEGNASLFEGHGNILMCKQFIVNGNIEGDCF